MKEEDLGNVLLMTVGTDGDVLPFVRIGRELKARGHDVTLLTHCSYEEMAREAGFDFVPFESRDEFEKSIEDRSLVHNPQGFLVYFRRHILPKLLALYGKIEERCRPGETVLVDRYAPGILSWIAAEKLGLPRVSVFPSPSYVIGAPFVETLYRSVADDINQIRARIGLPPEHRWQAWWQSPERNIGLWPEWFAAPQPDWSVEVTPTGFVLENSPTQTQLPEAVREILASGEAPVLIAGSTGAFFVKPEFYTASAQACRLLGRRAILVARQQEFVPNDLPDGVSKFDHLPFGAVMPHTEAIIHHGGIGTLGQALAAGKPQVVLAVGADRPDNAARLQRLEVGAFLPPPLWQPEAIADALRRLIESPQVRAHAQELAHQVHTANAIGAACDVIEGLLASRPPGDNAEITREMQPSGKALHTFLPFVSPETSAPDSPDAVLPQLKELSQERLELLALWLEKEKETVSARQLCPAGQASDEQGIIIGAMPLTPSQAWFFSNDFLDAHWWNVSHAFKVNRAQIKPDLLEQAAWHILSHHDALRARFVSDESGWKQIIAAPEEIASPFSYIDLSALPKEQRDQAADLAKTEAQKSLDLSKGSLFRVVLLDTGAMRNQLLIFGHHLVMDEISFQLILQDLLTAYQQLSDGAQVQLPPKTTPLKAWAERAHEYAQSPEFERQVDKWLALPWEQTAPLPVDYPDGRAKNTMASTGVVWTSLSVDETAVLLKDVPKVYGAQVVEALLMALVESVAGWAARPWVTVNVIKSGRTVRIPGTEYMDLTRTVGWLAMVEVLLLEHKRANHPGEALESIKEQLRGLRGKGMLLHMARLSRQYGKKGRFPDHLEELSFNYIGKSAQPAIGIGGAQSAPIFAGSARSDACHRNIILGCVGTISGNRLIWYWDYGKNVYERATVEKIAASFMASLRALIAHCQSVSKENFMQDTVK